MSPDIIKIAIDASALILSLLAMGVATLATRRKGLDTRLHLGSKRMDEQDLRIQRLEQSVAAMPGKDDVHGLSLALSDMNGELKAIRAHMKGMSESMARTESIVSRHEDHLRGDRA